MTTLNISCTLSLTDEQEAQLFMYWGIYNAFQKPGSSQVSLNDFVSMCSGMGIGHILEQAEKITAGERQG